MKTGTNRISGLGWRLLRCIGLLAGLAGLAAGSAWAEDADADPQRTAGPVRILDLACASRLRPHEIAPRHFVLDRVTDCELRRIDRAESIAGVRLEIASGAGISAAAAKAAASGSRDARQPRGDLQQGSVASSRQARWSRTRDRLSNPQYASSLRVVGQGIRQRLR